MPELYKNLDVDLDQIRLLVLHPGQGQDELSANLEVASLKRDEKAPELAYEALSYVWGKNSTTAAPPTIRLGPAGQTGRELQVSLQITPNLNEALRMLRYEHKPRTLWVDALCINQQDIDERSAQVSMMRAVFAQATCVSVWLGQEEATEHTAALINFFQRLKESRWNTHWREAYILPLHPPGTAFGALAAFFGRSWWLRTWTFQEVAVARDVVLHVGNRAFSWDMLRAAVDGFQMHKNHQRCCCTVRGLDAFHGIMTNLEEIIEYRNHRSNLDVLDFISWNRHRDATDPRDKIFGFTGLRLSDKLFDRGLLNYTLPADEIYRRWTIHLIRQMNSLDIFSHILPREEEKTLSSRPESIQLPSWVPNWMQTPSHESLMLLQHHIRILGWFNAADRTRPRLFIPPGEDAKEITLCGTAVDRVVHVLEPAGPALKVKVPALYHWREAIGVDLDPSKPYVARVGGNILEAFRNAIYPGAASILSNFRTPLHAPPTSNDWIMHDAWWWTGVLFAYELETAEAAGVPNPNTTLSSLGGGPGIIGSNINQFVAGKRMFVTGEGYFGLGPENVQEGDDVVVLLGGRVPFLLREKRGADVDRPATASYELVGGCSVHGLMKGEAIERVENGELFLKDFVLV